MLALLVHLALLVFLWIGVSWQSETGDTVEAEVWDTRSARPLHAQLVNSRNWRLLNRQNYRHRKKALLRLPLRL